MRRIGTTTTIAVAGESVRAFVPYPLPPRDPSLDLSSALLDLLRRAEQAMARLDGLGAVAPVADWIVHTNVRYEAVLSSQIEGTHSTLSDVLHFEARGREQTAATDADLEETLNAVEALEFAIDELRRVDGLPLSIRLLNRAHAVLMQGVRGRHSDPGQIRRSQNWIGGARPSLAIYVPPPPDQVAECYGALEKYVHADDELPKLIRVGLVHVQFETIHPYLDGNGRLGRLLMLVLLEHWGLMRRPLLPISLHLLRQRSEYYRRLNAVRTMGDWEGWTEYFLRGVESTANQAFAAAQRAAECVARDRARLLAMEGTSVGALRLFESLADSPVVSVARTVETLGTTKPTASKAIAVLQSLGILREVTGKWRDRLWSYDALLSALALGGESA